MLPFFLSEFLDERGVIVREFECGSEARAIKKIFETHYSHIEALYLHRWPETRKTDGTAHFGKDIMYIQVRNSILYLLRKSEKGKLIEGHEIRHHPKTAVFNLKKYIDDL